MVEIQFDEADFIGDYLLIGYTKLVKNSDELCMVCQTDETKDGKQWHRYQLVCRHIAHTRCLRRWCMVKGRLNCFHCCDDIKRKRRNRYCEDCDKFGHDLEECAFAAL